MLNCDYLPQLYNLFAPYANPSLDIPSFSQIIQATGDPNQRLGQRKVHWHRLLERRRLRLKPALNQNQSKFPLEPFV